MKSVVLAAGLVLAGSIPAAASNTLVSYSGLGNPTVLNGVTYPVVTLSPGNAANPANVADGVLQWVPGTYNPPIHEQRGVVDIELPNFTQRPLCSFQFDYYQMMTAGTFNIQNLSQYSNEFAVNYYLDGSNKWHVQPYFSYEFDLNTLSATNIVPWQINFTCVAE